MKKTLKSVVAVLLTAAILYAFCSCSLFSSIRKRVEEANNTTLAATPEEKEVVDHFNGLLSNSVDRAEKINEKIDAGALGKSAGMLKKLVAEKKPGKAERTIEDKNISDTLLSEVEADKLLDFDFSRNTRVVNVTDEAGKEVANDNGENVTEIRITDNILKTVFKYFKDVADKDATTSEPAEGETAAEPTTRVLADDGVINEVFGDAADKAEVLANFDCIKEYVSVVDYTITNGSCEIRSDIDLVASDLSDIVFFRPMTVTATVKGVGALEKYGELTVTVELEKTVSYSFVYSAEATTAE